MIITVEELLKYHRDKFSGNKVIREYILENEDWILDDYARGEDYDEGAEGAEADADADIEIDDDIENEYASEVGEGQQQEEGNYDGYYDEEYYQEYDQHPHKRMEFGFEIDDDNLEPVFDESTQEYLKDLEQHRIEFLKEIKQKGLSLKNPEISLPKEYSKYKIDQNNKNRDTHENEKIIVNY